VITSVVVRQVGNPSELSGSSWHWTALLTHCNALQIVHVENIVIKMMQSALFQLHGAGYQTGGVHQEFSPA
jgi:hypothetical protein